MVTGAVHSRFRDSFEGVMPDTVLRYLHAVIEKNVGRGIAQVSKNPNGGNQE